MDLSLSVGFSTGGYRLPYEGALLTDKKIQIYWNTKSGLVDSIGAQQSKKKKN